MKAVWIAPPALCLLLVGCHHRQMPPILPPPVLQAPEKPPPAPPAPTMEGPPPETLSTAPAVKVTEAKPKRRPRKVPTKTTASPASVAPVEMAAAVPTPEKSVIGQLSTGGDASPLSQREVNDLIASNDRRLEALLKTKASQQQEQIREIRHFIQQAREALTTGDAEGAKTLATKAKLLLDDIEKWAQP